MKNFLLAFIAIVLFVLIAPIGFAYQIIRKFNVKSYFFKIAICIDQSGNVVCSKLFDDLLIKKNGYLFGQSEDETISSVLGKNKLKGTLTFLGKFLSLFLNAIDKNHVEKSIGK